MVDSHPAPAPTPTVDLPALHGPIATSKGIRSTRNPHPIYTFMSYHRLSAPYYAFVSTLSSISIPKKLSEALSYPGWKQEMIDEMDALHSCGK